jgi:hypothetical protein
MPKNINVKTNSAKPSKSPSAICFLLFFILMTFLLDSKTVFISHCPVGNAYRATRQWRISTSSRRVRHTTDSTWVKTPKGLKMVENGGCNDKRSQNIG